MDVSFSSFLQEVTASPVLLITVLLTLGVIFVNGWTDAPNAIATCVVTRCMSPRAAILMAAVFNFLGVLLMSMINATVAETITQMVDFGTNSHEAIVALSAALGACLWFAPACGLYHAVQGAACAERHTGAGAPAHKG